MNHVAKSDNRERGHRARHQCGHGHRVTIVTTPMTQFNELRHCLTTLAAKGYVTVTQVTQLCAKSYHASAVFVKRHAQHEPHAGGDQSNAMLDRLEPVHATHRRQPITGAEEKERGLAFPAPFLATLQPHATA